VSTPHHESPPEPEPVSGRGPAGTLPGGRPLQKQPGAAGPRRKRKGLGRRLVRLFRAERQPEIVPDPGALGPDRPPILVPWEPIEGEGWLKRLAGRPRALIRWLREGLREPVDASGPGGQASDLDSEVSGWGPVRPGEEGLPRLPRRAFLYGSLALVVAGGLALAARSLRLREQLLRWLEPQFDASSPPGQLTAAEIESMAAFGEVIVEGRALNPVSRRALAQYIDERAQSQNGYFRLYRDTAALVDRLAGRRFAELPVADRAAIVSARIFARDDRSRRREHRFLFERREERAVRFAIPDLIRGYYTSAGGWRVVGYSVPWGECSDLTRYTRPERRLADQT
jgi:hypothetical protein